MRALARFLHWPFAAAGFLGILGLDLHVHEPGLAVVVAFLLAGVLSTMRPGLAPLWAALAGGAVVASEAMQAVADPAFATAKPGVFALLALLPIAIGIAGAAAGAAVALPAPRNGR